MEKLKEITNEILDLRGKTVSIFGQSCTLDSEVSPYLIDVVDILNAFEEYEVSDFTVTSYDEENEETEVQLEDLDSYLEYLEGFGLKEVDCGNSYNWSSNISNDINFDIYKCNDEYYVVLKVHKYGDIRTNYTDEVLLKFDSDCGFLNVLSDCYKLESVTVDGKDYSLYINPISEDIEVGYEGEDIGTIYGSFYDEKGVVEEIKSLIA